MTKAELRQKYKDLRKQFSPSEIERQSSEIVENTLKHFQLEGKVVSMFLPIERQGEINTYLLLERCKNIGATVVLPKCNFETSEIKHYLFENEQQLELNEKGIPEPKKGKVVAADKIDVVFVPLLAADKKGNRVGYGKGFYDRFLRKCVPNCLFIGLHYFELEDKIDDVIPTDVRMNVIISPNKIYRID